MKEIELIGKRKAREKHFLKQNGVIEAQVFDEDIHFLRVMFTDLLGTIKSVDLPVSQLDKLMDNKIMFVTQNIKPVSISLISKPR